MGHPCENAPLCTLDFGHRGQCAQSLPGTPEHLRELIRAEVERPTGWDRATGRKRHRYREAPLADRLTRLLLDNHEVVARALAIEQRRRELVGG
jgi:hypothetical protein